MQSRWIKALNEEYYRITFKSREIWNQEEEKMTEWHWVCGYCHFSPNSFPARTNFCPYCGAEMENPNTEKNLEFHEIHVQEYAEYKEKE